MELAEIVGCESFACDDVDHTRYLLPPRPENPDDVTIVMIAEAPPADPADWFHAGGDALYAQTTVQAFRDAGEDVRTIEDILALGVHLTTAVKCAKTAYGISTATTRACSLVLEAELGVFPLARALLLMGDTAIASVNWIAKRNGEPPPVPHGSTYRLRGGDYRWRGMRVFPSYVQAGKAFLIEASKRRMIAEDVAAALAFVRR